MVLAMIRKQFGSALSWAERGRYTAEQAPTLPEPRVLARRQPAHRSDWPIWISGTDPRFMSPRQMVELSTRLHESGQLNGEDRAALGFQVELHPDFGRTIGGLTGAVPSPDTPRNHLRDWEERLEFAITYTPAHTHRIAQIRRIIAVLSHLASLRDVVPMRGLSQAQMTP